MFVYRLVGRTSYTHIHDAYAHIHDAKDENKNDKADYVMPFSEDDRTRTLATDGISIMDNININTTSPSPTSLFPLIRYISIPHSSHSISMYYSIN